MKKGFTLVELIIVVTILGILAAIVLPEFQGHAAQSKESAFRSSLHTVRAQIELYKMQHNGLNPGYLGSAQCSDPMLEYQFVGVSRIDGFAINSTTPANPLLYGPYLLELPTNPFNGKSDINWVSAAVTDFTTQTNESSGWLYQKETGIFKINKSEADSGGINYVDY